MDNKEDFKTLAFYQSLSDEFKKCPSDYVPLSPEMVRLHLQPNDFIVYSMLIDKLRFVLPPVVTSVPIITTSISDIAAVSNLTNDEVKIALKNLESRHKLIELTPKDNDVEICVYDISRAIEQKGE